MWSLGGEFWGEFTCKPSYFWTLFTLWTYLQNWDYKAGMFVFVLPVLLQWDVWHFFLSSSLLLQSSLDLQKLHLVSWKENGKNTVRDKCCPSASLESVCPNASLESVRLSWVSASPVPRCGTHRGPWGTCWLRWAPVQDWSPSNRPLAPQTDLQTQILESWFTFLNHGDPVFFRSSPGELLNFQSHVF